METWRQLSEDSLRAAEDLLRVGRFRSSVSRSYYAAYFAATCEIVQSLTTFPNGRFDGEPLQSAQIDHLIVGPSGVFVIEVKNWTRKFVEQQNYFDPLQQVARASYLCYNTLRYEFSGIRVRSIIVNCNALPVISQKHRVKVVALSELRGYITWRHQPALESKTVTEIVKSLYG